MIFEAATVENDVFDTFTAAAFSDALSDFGRAFDIATINCLFFTGAGGRERVPRGIVDSLGVDVFPTPKNSKSWTDLGPSNFLPDA
jgi:hypothetical protein